MKKVRFCYILTTIFVTSFELFLAVFSHGYYFQFNMMGKQNYKELVYVKIILVLVANWYVMKLWGTTIRGGFLDWCKI